MLEKGSQALLDQSSKTLWSKLPSYSVGPKGDGSGTVQREAMVADWASPKGLISRSPAISARAAGRTTIVSLVTTRV
ncbi:hypothetical protein TIFTF001_055466 [Ficus carica]|uniref:Uncharacterized protein n=2 Tax=Ficus carica TaxID=3494 RepID=A0AA88EA64_FICCA|nr:hypothetical protein TIFTF001_055466 [Ficus carica]